MERHCKNCDELIYAGKNNCANCGCKWIENRITMKQVGHDFADMYIGIDTKFVRTFIDLFIKPEAVILGYINGRRVNYMDAIRYLLLALFVSGIYTFVLTKTGVLDNMMNVQTTETVEAYEKLIGMSHDAAVQNAANSVKYTRIAFEFQGFILLLTIPFLAIVARVTFLGKQYFNFTEQIVFYLYTYGHSVIITTPFTILLLFTFPEGFTYLGFVSLPLLYLYNAYCYKRCFRLDYQTAATKTLISIFVAVGIMIGLGIALAILGIIVGIILKATGII